MSKQANKTLIGGFVVGAAVIVVIGILIFGSGRLLAEKQWYVLFFEGSVKGLTIGAPVRLKGVAVGQVADMKLLMEQESMKFYNEVIIEVFPGKIATVGQGGSEVSLPRMEGKTGVELLISTGLRAKLDMTSYVTGQLYVAFDFYPDTEARIRGFKTEYTELPTLPSDLEHLAEKLKQIPFADLVDQTLAAVEGINQLVRSPEIKEALVNLNQTLQDAGNLARKLDGQVAPLALELTDSMRDTRQLVNNLNRKVPAVADEIIAAMKSTAALIEKTNESSVEIYNLVEENSAFRYNLNETLSELSSAGRSIRLLADYLEQHPEALLYGKPGGK